MKADAELCLYPLNAFLPAESRAFLNTLRAVKFATANNNFANRIPAINH